MIGKTTVRKIHSEMMRFTALDIFSLDFKEHNVSHISAVRDTAIIEPIYEPKKLSIILFVLYNVTTVFINTVSMIMNETEQPIVSADRMFRHEDMPSIN